VLNQGMNIESIAPPRSFGPECYDVTTARTIPDADFQAVTLTPRTSPASYW
jgi:hypothetical protein